MNSNHSQTALIEVFMFLVLVSLIVIIYIEDPLLHLY